jgi:hypothetical protein
LPFQYPIFEVVLGPAQVVTLTWFQLYVDDSSDLVYAIFNNNNNQAFYSQASWGKLEMKPHEQKKKKQGQNKSIKEGGKQSTVKNQIEKGEKAIKC